METVFTSEEITTLLKALDAWEHEASSGAIMSSMLGMALLKDENEAKKYMDETLQKSDKETERRKEDAILLRAKLVTIKRTLVATQLFNGVDIRA